MNQSIELLWNNIEVINLIEKELWESKQQEKKWCFFKKIQKVIFRIKDLWSR